jgi:hypothetical protein
MTEQGLISLFLFLHIGAAIIAFWSTFAFPIIVSLAANEPQHRNFAIRANEAIVARLVIPLALTMPITGLLLIWFAHFNLLDRVFWWLDIAIVLYVILVYVGIFLQHPALLRAIELTSRPPGGQGASAMPGAPGAPAAGAPAGPPPEVAAAGARIQRNGIVLTILIVVIVFLMVVKPQF